MSDPWSLPPKTLLSGQLSIVCVPAHLIREIHYTPPIALPLTALASHLASKFNLYKAETSQECCLQVAVDGDVRISQAQCSYGQPLLAVLPTFKSPPVMMWFLTNYKTAFFVKKTTPRGTLLEIFVECGC